MSTNKQRDEAPQKVMGPIPKTLAHAIQGALRLAETDPSVTQLLQALPKYKVSPVDDMLLPKPCPDGVWVPIHAVEVALRSCEARIVELEAELKVARAMSEYGEDD